ncbi:MAG: hypothetical protein WCA38_21295 [Candidatus Acidiferrales bacterium]
MNQMLGAQRMSLARRGRIFGILVAGLGLAAGGTAIFSYPPSLRAYGVSESNALGSGAAAAKNADKKSPSRFVADKGKFRISVAGQQLGKEEFEIAPNGSDWTAHGTAEIQSQQGNTHVTGTLAFHPDGTPVHYEWSTQSAKKASAAIAFNGLSATVELHIEGARPFTQKFTFTSPEVIVLDNNLYHHYALLAQLYDWNKKGSQSFSVLVPQEMTPGTVTAESMGKQDVGGKKLEELRVKTEDNEIDLFLDGPKLMRVVAPAANAEIIREESK